MVIHDYGLDETFTRRVQQGIVEAVKKANASLSTNDCSIAFSPGSRELGRAKPSPIARRGQVYWVGPQTNFITRPRVPLTRSCRCWHSATRATPMRAIIFNHSAPHDRHPSCRPALAWVLQVGGRARARKRAGRDGLLPGRSEVGFHAQFDCLSGEEDNPAVKRAVLDAFALEQAA